MENKPRLRGATLTDRDTGCQTRVRKPRGRQREPRHAQQRDARRSHSRWHPQLCLPREYRSHSRAAASHAQPQRPRLLPGPT
eukprot:4766181-Lingulodinium_polyedra.AAC.1